MEPTSGAELWGRAVGLAASGALVGVSEEELGFHVSMRAEGAGHCWEAETSLSSLVRVLLPRYFG